MWQVLGTPNEETWPTMADLPEYRGDFPQHDPARDTHAHTQTHACTCTAHGGEMSVHHRPQALHRPTTCSLTSSSLCDQVSFATTAPKLCSDGLDLLTQMLRYEPGHRISAKAAMSHPYFKELDQTRFKAA